MRVIAICTLHGLLTVASAFGADFKVTDTFDDAKLRERAAVRGEFEFNDGVMKVEHNPDLYKKYKDHGPMVVYAGQFKDADVHLRFRLGQTTKADSPARGAFTFDGASGHVMRVFTLTNAKGRIIAWKEGDTTPVTLTKELPKLKAGVWYDLKVSSQGNKATVELAGETISVEHEAIARPKTNAKYSTAFATMELDQFTVAGK